jgi:hypothetical protein
VWLVSSSSWPLVQPQWQLLLLLLLLLSASQVLGQAQASLAEGSATTATTAAVLQARMGAL